jgi:Beta-1,3-glucanase
VRRAEFLTAAMAATVAGGRAAARPIRWTTHSSIPLTIVNATQESPSRDVFFAVIGVDQNGVWVHLRQDGMLVPCRQRDNGPSGYADYSLRLGRRRAMEVALPQIPGGARLYVSIGDPLGFPVSGANVPGSPSGWTPQDPNYRILFDWIEFTYNENGWGGNTTMVDMFGLPLEIALRGSTGVARVGVVPGGRERIFANLREHPAFSPLLVIGDGEIRRAISPFHGIDAGVFDARYLQAYIDAVWSKYRSDAVKMDAAGYGKFEGRVDANGRLVFTQPGQPAIAFDRPATRDVFACAGAIAPRNCGQSPSQACSVQGQIAAALGAAFNRTTLLLGTEIPYCRLENFYRNAATNVYSAVMHAQSRGGLAYGFPFDDNCNEFSSFIFKSNPTAVRVTIPPF